MTNSAAKYYTLDASFSYVLGDAEPSIVEFLDAASEHLDALGTEDLFVVSNEDAKEFLISQLVESSAGESIETVVGKGLGALRTAFHACNADTPGWPSINEAVLAVELTQASVRNELAPKDEPHVVGIDDLGLAST